MIKHPWVYLSGQSNHLPCSAEFTRQRNNRYWQQLMKSLHSVFLQRVKSLFWVTIAQPNLIKHVRNFRLHIGVCLGKVLSHAHAAVVENRRKMNESPEHFLPDDLWESSHFVSRLKISFFFCLFFRTSHLLRIPKPAQFVCWYLVPQWRFSSRKWVRAHSKERKSTQVRLCVLYLRKSLESALRSNQNHQQSRKFRKYRTRIEKY